MIISHRYRFIFIKTHKTAGSSMEMALGPLCGPDDIVTPMESNSRTRIPQNYHEDTWIGQCYARSRLFRKLFNRHSPRIGAWYYEHMPATRVRELIGNSVWNDYYKFCFERNPWEKVVSYYHWKKFGQRRRLPPFQKYVMKKTHRLPLDARLYFDGTTCLMDDVFDFRDFHNSFEKVCKMLGIPFDGNMPKEKTNIISSKPNYRTFYNSNTRDKVAECFQREINLMGYYFDTL